MFLVEIIFLKNDFNAETNMAQMSNENDQRSKACKKDKNKNKTTTQSTCYNDTKVVEIN
jgi:hypothetical protein